MSPSPNDTDGEGESESSPTNWGEIFGDLVCHTSIPHSEILYLTLPQIEAYRVSIGKNIPIKIGVSSMFGGMMDSPQNMSGESTQEDVESFFGGF